MERWYVRFGERNVVAGSAVFAGAAAALAAAIGFSWSTGRPWKIGPNDIFFFMTGAYAAATAVWLADHRTKRFVPLFVTLGAVFGAILDFVLAGIILFVLLSFDWVDASNRPAVLASLVAILIAGSIFPVFGAKFFCQIERQAPPGVWGRVLLLLKGYAYLGVPFAGLWMLF